MVHANLIPRERLEARRCRVRLVRWGTACTIHAIVTLVAFGLSRVGGVDQQAVAHELHDVEREIASSRSKVADMQLQVQQAQSELAAGQTVGNQPDWSVLLALLSSMLGDEIVLRGCEAKVGTATPKLEISGLGRTQKAVSQFVLRLEDCSLFSQVRQSDTQREPFRDGYAVAFRIQCIIDPGLEEGRP